MRAARLREPMRANRIIQRLRAPAMAKRPALPSWRGSLRARRRPAAMEGPLNRRVLSARAASGETGAGGAGTERGDSDAGALDSLGEGLGKRNTNALLA